MKKFIALALASVMTLSLAACGGGGEDAAVAGTPISGDTIKIGVFEPTTGETQLRPQLISTAQHTTSNW